jgi:hypothetical protein
MDPPGVTRDEARDGEVTRIVKEAFERADSLEQEGLEVDALHVLREALGTAGVINDGNFEIKRDGGRILIGMNPFYLALRARESVLSLTLGQRASSLHDFLGLYERADPILPERSPVVRLWMDRLRVSAAAHHGDWKKALAWSLDLFNFGLEVEDRYVEVEGLLGMATFCAQLGLAGSATQLFGQVLQSPRYSESMSTAFRWQARLNFASTLFSVGLEDQALAEYEDIANEIALSEPTVDSRRVNLHVLRRRADCYRRLGQIDAAEADLVAAFQNLDALRGQQSYQGARSSDHAHRTELRALRDLIFGIPGLTPVAVLEIVTIVMNSAVAGALRSTGRGDRARRRPTVYLTGDREATLSAHLVDDWSPVNAATLRNIAADQLATVFIDIDTARSPMRGFTASFGGSGEPTFSTWDLTEAESDIVRQLLTTPRFQNGAATDGWRVEHTDPRLRSLGRKMFKGLRQRVARSAIDGVRVCPLYALWRFPFLAVDLDGEPLGKALPVVLSTPAASNVTGSTSRRWLGHFDLTLPLAIEDLQAFLRTARAVGATPVLFNEPADVPAEDVALVLFAGHAAGSGSDQHLVLANRVRMYADAIENWPSGCSVVLDACWSAAITDRPGTEQVDLSLMILARGAHSVIGSVGPVLDVHASQMFRSVLRHLAQGVAGAKAVQAAVKELLDADPSLPLAAWASYVTVGRHTQFADDA